ncbi:UNVERIFIED_CONTAM: hypothetical protein K2H54_068200 [Gekko kuhli]
MVWGLSSSAFYILTALLLLLCLTWMIWRGNMWPKWMDSRTWRRFLPFSTQGPQESTVRPQTTEEEGKGTSGPAEGPQLGQSHDGNSGRGVGVSIRRMLCDDLACPVCERTASEAQKVVRSRALNAWFPESRPPSLPTASYVEHARLPAAAVLEDHHAIPQSTREPTPSGDGASRGPAAAPSPSRMEQPSSCGEQQGKKKCLRFAQEASHNIGACEEGSGNPHGQAGCDGKGGGCNSAGRGPHKENCRSSSPSKPEATVPNWTPDTSSPGPPESSDFSQEEPTASSCHEGSRQNERDLSSDTEDGGQDWSLPAEPRRKPLRSSPKASPVQKAKPQFVSRGTQNSFGAVDMTDDMRETLEWHLTLKRAQHELGLPFLLLRSLRAFLPLAPDPTFLWPPRRDSVVVETRPQVLPFLRVATRRRLEQHVKKMVHLQRWGLPGRVQGALRHLWPDSHGATEGTPSVSWKEDAGGTSQGNANPNGYSLQFTTRGGNPALESSPDSHPALRTSTNCRVKLQIHVVKKSFEVGQETFPKVVEDSQGITSPKERKQPLPKLIPGHRSGPQQRRGPSLFLRQKAESVEMNVKRKRIHFLSGFPTLYNESLYKMAPRVHGRPAAPPRARHAVDFAPAVTSFLALHERQHLDHHVLRKRVQHQWGLPRLAHQSLLQFLPVAPCLVPRLAYTACIHVKVEMLPGSAIPFITSETKKRMEEHLRSKIVERRWGLPMRAMESLRAFMPQPPPLSGDSGRASVPVQDEGILQRSPSVEATDPAKGQDGECSPHTKHPALQRHVAQKALEIHLALLSSATRPPQAGKCSLPKTIPPGLEAQRPRPRDLFFVEPAALGSVELNITHKGLMHRWGLPTLYQKSLSSLFQETPRLGAPPPPLVDRRGPGLAFTFMEALFLGPTTREELEWHVMRKQLQHAWGLPRLAQRSLRSLLPAAPRLPHQWSGPVEVRVLLAEPVFLGEAAMQELERNVRKRIISQQWQLPKRVLQSLKLLHPERQLESGRHRGALDLGTKSTKYGAKALSRRVPPILSTLGAKPRQKLEVHLAKKCVEGQLGSPPVLPGPSWRPLPRPILRGQRVLQPRSSFCSVLCTGDVDRIERAVHCSHLASLWGLGTRYVDTCRGLLPALPAWAVRPSGTVLEPREVPTAFLPEQERATLEFHVRKKKIQHEWRAPVLVRSSLRAFVEEAPKVPARQKMNVHVHIVQVHKLPFLSPQDHRGLEFHMQKRNLQRNWGLPKRVLQSLRRLCPAVVDVSSTERGTRNLRSRAVLAPRRPHLLPMLHSEALEEMELHLEKKHVEAQLGVLPELARLPRQSTLTSLGHLPKSIPPGCKSLQARSSFLPFARAEDVDRIELVMHHTLLMSLWGLGRSYVEAVGAMTPRLPFQPLKTRGTALVLSPVQTPFLPSPETEDLELHVRRKRLQHEWELPVLLQRSLASFMGGAPAPAPLQKPPTQVQTRPEELLFLPTDTRDYLEQHLQSTVCQRQWGLPQKILRFLKPLCLDGGVAMLGRDAAEPPVSLPEGSGKKFPESLAEEEWDAMDSFRMRASSRQGTQPFNMCSSKVLQTIHFHLVKKCVAMHSGIFPDAVQLSWQGVPGSLGQPLCTPIPPGYHSPRTGSPFLPFPQGEEPSQEELVVLGRHPPFSCMPGRSYVEAPGDKMPGPPSRPFESRKTALVWAPVETPFLPYQEREDLELHMRRKRIQHEWGLPGLVQRSLAGFMGGAPSPTPLQKTLIQVQTAPQELLFLPTEVCSCLERHVQSMVRQRQWGLPQKILRFLQPLCLDLGLGMLGEKAPVPHLSIPERSYAEAERATTPRPPSQPLRSGEAGTEFAEVQTPYLQAQVREDLELHVRKKKLQHEWGLPGLIQRSLHGFIQRAPSEPILQKTEASVQILLKEPGFLPQSCYNHLEFHVQQIKVQRQWRLPGRVLESLKHLFPGLRLHLPQPERSGPGETFPYHPGTETVSERSPVGGLHTEEGGREAARPKMATPPHTQVLWKLEPKMVDGQQPDMTRKGLPVKSEALPAVADPYWRQRPLPLRHGLPRVTPPGSMLDQPSSSSWPFDRSQEADQTEKAPRSSPVGPYYMDVLGGVVPQMPSEWLSPRRTGAEFSEASTPFLPEQEREALEVLILRKKIHHAWGFPVLVQKSLKAFVGEFPLLPAPQKTNILVNVVPGELPFLPWDVSRHLEWHVQKMNLQRQWELPRRVVQSLRRLHPGLGDDAHRSKTPRSYPEQLWRTSLGRTRSGSPTVWGREGKVDVVQGRDQLLSTVGSETLKKMQLHLTKKDLEVQLQALPTVAARSQQHASLSTGRALPKPILPSRGAQQPRSDFLPFMHKEDVDRVELAVQRHHFATLWGLSVRFVEVLAGMAPRLPPQFSKHQGADVVFSEVETPFLQEEGRGTLEDHVKKKVVQHLWGMPRLVQRSLVAFMCMAPSLPTYRKPETEVHPLLQEMPFLPPGTQNHLEQHLQRLVLQRQWGLPKRVLHSLKIFCPPALVTTAPLSQRDEEEEQQAQRKKGPMNISAEQESAMQEHLSQKHLEIQAEAPLGIMQKMGGLGRGHLPRLIPVGQESPPKRDTSPPFLPPHAVDELELSAKPLTFARGLPGKHMESQFHVPALTSKMTISFQETETPFLKEEEKQVLEHHLKKKRLQHQWGLPLAITRSLQAFAPSPLVPPHPPQRAGREIKIRVEEPFFLTALLWEDLEDSVKKMLIHRQWGLPKRVCNSLRALSPAVLAKEGLAKPPQPSVLVPEAGGGYEMEPEELLQTFLCSEGSPWQGKPGRSSSPHIHLPNVMPEQYWRIPDEPPELRRRAPSPHTPPLPCASGPEHDQLPHPQELSYPARREGPAVNTSVETLFWDKEKILHQLDRSLQRVAQVSHPETSHVICTPCECHTETYRRDVAFSYEMSVWERCQQRDPTPPLAKEAAATSSVSSEEHETQNFDLSSGESTTDVSLLCQAVAQENLLKPPKLDMGRLLCTHVTQKALGSFILPPCVIGSHSRYEDMVTRQHRQKAREQREWLNSWFLKRKSYRGEFKDTHQGLSSKGRGANAVDEAQQAPVAVLTGEPKERARVSLREAPPRHRLNSPQSTYEGLQSSEEERGSSGKDSNVSGEPYLKQLSSLDMDDEFPAPPSDWIQSEAEEREPESHAITACSTASRTSSRNPPEQPSPPVEDWSQFSTEWEEERVGDWNSDSVVCSSKEEEAAEEEGRRVQKRAAKAGSRVRPRGEGASSRRSQDADRRVSIIASILDKKLWLQHGLHAWLDSQSEQRPSWRKRNRQWSSLDRTGGEKAFQRDSPGRAEPPLGGAAPVGRADPSSGDESDGDTHRQAGTLAPGSQQLEAERRGSPLRPSTPTSSTCDRVPLGKPSRLDLSQKKRVRMEGELAWDRRRRKPLALVVGAQGRREDHSQERGEGRAGSREWPSGGVRETGSCEREGPAVGREEGTSSEAQTSGSKEWTPPGLRRRFLTKEWRLHRREKGSTARVRFKDPCFSPVQVKKNYQENKVVLRSGHHQTSLRTSRHSGDFVARGHQAEMETGLAAQEASRADLRGRPQGHRDPAPTASVGRPEVPLYGEHFPSLKEKILSRRRELESSSESEEEEEEKLA